MFYACACTARARCDARDERTSTLRVHASSVQRQFLTTWLVSIFLSKKAIKAEIYFVKTVIKFVWIINLPNNTIIVVSKTSPAYYVYRSYTFYHSFHQKEMGCVNCKPTQRSPKASLGGSDGPSRAQKTTGKRQRKSMRLFLRALLSANSKKSRSSSRIAPESSSSQSNSPSLVCFAIL